MKNIFRFVSVIGVALIVLIAWCDHVIDSYSSPRLFNDVLTIPFNKTALLPGTSKFLSNGTTNPYYESRIVACLQLYHAGKIQYIIASGDNGTANYNEPEIMRADLISGGVDSSHIYLDYAGFRTFDSVVRAKEIFGQSNLTVISQPFHNERAIYIAHQEGLSAIGYNATDLEGILGLKVQVREKLARFKVFLDYYIGAKPRYLGETVTLP